MTSAVISSSGWEPPRGEELGRVKICMRFLGARGPKIGFGGYFGSMGGSKKGHFGGGQKRVVFGSIWGGVKIRVFREYRGNLIASGQVRSADYSNY